jgi:hypothetical protein
MERSLRDLIAETTSEDFRGVYIEGPLNATRANVLAPGSVGAYTGGSIYNPAQVLRTASTSAGTAKIDQIVEEIPNKGFKEVSLSVLRRIVELTMPDESLSERVWDQHAVAESITQFGKLYGQSTGYIYVDRDREGKAVRRETQGILAGGEASNVPVDKLTLFALRSKSSRGEHPAWWPQVRFPRGRYAFAFAI